MNHHPSTDVSDATDLADALRQAGSNVHMPADRREALLALTWPNAADAADESLVPQASQSSHRRPSSCTLA